jgi:hypothetical protein
MSLRLRDHLHWCECEGRIILLDVAADRYFCLPANANAAFLALAAGRAVPPDNRSIEALTERGFLVTSATRESFQQPAAIEKPARDFVGNDVPPSGVVALLRALWWEYCGARQLRTRTLSDVVASARRRSQNLAGASSGSENQIRSIASAADAIAIVTRSHDRCLVRAIGVHGACTAGGIPAKLVIGVIGHPFAAHSWVQLGDAVLVGGYEQARLYTPILVIG